MLRAALGLLLHRKAAAFVDSSLRPELSWEICPLRASILIDLLMISCPALSAPPTGSLVCGLVGSQEEGIHTVACEDCSLYVK
ncbi:uncharacterized protein GGS25DRAFT_476644 [Hypoxylon fragiforme]|uniref:uncharacterized protein n=1 Tax=Hypoxylon fragiforme TaxID=63214 RepID=UPI0020C61327|nr:uncharacterized protein GGS25DRAFT_476644 [Hypoxylon fragiforme]KAI2612693.1 hypothetical protein GGS25DRAFT_476644 [Hypoxylon fragiforme]